MANRKVGTGQLARFVGELYHPDGQLRTRIATENLERVFDDYDLTEWQRQILCTYDRDKIAEAVYWDILATPPYPDAAEDEVHILWPNPERAILAADTQVDAVEAASFSVVTRGLRISKSRFVLVSLAAHLDIPASEQTLSDTSSIENQAWTLTFDLRAAKAGDVLRLKVDDGSGVLVAKRPAVVKTAAT